MRVPKTRYPLSVEKSYARNGQRAVTNLERITLKFMSNELKDLLQRASVNDRAIIGDDVIDWIEELLNKLKQLIIGTLTDGDAQDMVTKYVNAINTSNKINVNSQINAALITHGRQNLGNGTMGVLSISPLTGDQQLASYMKAKIKENVSYVKDIRDEYSRKITQIIYRGVTNGDSYGDMQQAIRHQAHLSRNRAKFIARDQSGSIYGQMTKARHQAAGINHFQWQTMEDERVRPSHAARQGVIYNYDTADLLPGEDYACRCVADPVFDDELDEAA